jgi:hypothetical protein
MKTSEILVECRASINRLSSIVKGLVKGQASIDYVGKTFVSRTPGDLTKEAAHN